MPPQSHVPPIAIERALDAIASLAPAGEADSTDGPWVELLAQEPLKTAKNQGVHIRHGLLHLPPTPVGDPRNAGGEILLAARYTDAGLPASSGTSLAGTLPLTGTARLVVAAPPKTWPIAGSVSIVPATGAAIVGKGAQREAANIGYYSDPGTELVWVLDFAEPGLFEVTLAVACVPNEAGSTFTLRIADTEFVGAVPATGGWQEYTELRLGEVDIRVPGRQEARFTPSSMPAGVVGNIGDLTLELQAP
jgi:hypothetical protein